MMCGFGTGVSTSSTQSNMRSTPGTGKGKAAVGAGYAGVVEVAEDTDDQGEGVRVN